MPLLPYSVGYKGQSIKFAKQINLVQDVEKLAQKIGEELQNPSEIAASNTLNSFNQLSRMIRQMNAKEINEAFRQLYHPDREVDTHSGKSSARNAAWKAYRDAVAEAGTPAAIDQVMEWIEENKIQGEEASQLIAGLPKTIRMPTNAVLRRFFVSLKFSLFVLTRTVS